MPSFPPPPPQPYPHWHGQLAIQRTRVMRPRFCLWCVHTYQHPWSHLPSCMSWGQVSGVCYLPLICTLQGPMSPTLTIKMIWIHYNHASHDYFNCCLYPSYYFDFYSHFLHSPMVKGCCMWFAMVPELPLTTVWFVLSDSQCHLSPLHDLISLKTPSLGLSSCSDLVLWAAVRS